MNGKEMAIKPLIQPDWKQSVAKDTSSIAYKGYIVFAVTLGVFMIWALFFPIADCCA